MTVIQDAKLTKLPKAQLAAALCSFSFVLGLIFVSRAGIYWFGMFDYYACVVSMFFVTFMECFWLMWGDDVCFKRFAGLVEHNVGRPLGKWLVIQWKYTCPVVLAILIVMAFETSDLMKAAASKPYPEGEGYLPLWSVSAGWKLGTLPLLAFVAIYLVQLEHTIDKHSELQYDPIDADYKPASQKHED